jgi:imidazoleglycerol-phosphate dehydratase
MREAAVTRTTNETDVSVALNLDGAGVFKTDMPLAFFGHMLAQTVRHGLLDLELKASGDVGVDCHHLIEDVGIVLGQALAVALGDKAGINRYGHALVPMDDALALCAADLSGRPFLRFDAAFGVERLGDTDTEMFREFFRALCAHAGLTLHIELRSGENAHHMAEAIFKAFGRALRMAVEKDARATGVPSTKGALQ